MCPPSVPCACRVAPARDLGGITLCEVASLHRRLRGCEVHEGEATSMQPLLCYNKIRRGQGWH